MKNTGTRNFPFSWDFEIRDAGGIQYDPWSDDYATREFDSLTKIANLGDQFPPGQRVNTALIFDINPSAKGLMLYLDQAKVSVELGQ